MANRFHLHLIRHAQSANNALPESERIEDPPITGLGRRQASFLAERFREQPITHLLTSGFLRAVQTMQPLANVLTQRPAIWTDLHEVGGCYRGHEAGKFEGRPGMNRETLTKKFPDFALPDDIDDAGWWKSQRYEGYQQAQVRAKRQAVRLLNEFQDTEAIVACVVHADFKALLLEALLKSDYREYGPADLVNTGVTLLSCTGQQIEVADFNCAGHLPADLVTS